MSNPYKNKTDRQLIEHALPPYILRLVLGTLNSEGDFGVEEEWLEVLDVASIKPLNHLENDTIHMHRLARRLEQDTATLLKATGQVDSTRSLVLAVCYFIAKLVDEGMVQDQTNQGVLFSLLVILEAEESGDWGDVNISKALAGKILDRMLLMGYYM